MNLTILRVVFLFACGGAIVAIVSPDSWSDENPMPAFVKDHAFLSSFLMMVITQSFVVLDLLIRKKQIEVISAVYFGLLVGVLLAFILIQGVNLIFPQDSGIKTCFVLISTLVFPYICISLLLQTKNDFRFVIPYVEFSRELKGPRPLVVDSSALIDGRIADVIDTNVIVSQLIVPEFVILEIQDVADSNDKVRRTRGRRGLEVLDRLQNNPLADVTVREDKPEDLDLKVDQRIVALAKDIGGIVLTNDYNLNKVASVQGIMVINLNDVANSLKPRYVPGERLRIKILKEGESSGQGVGYLDDGTMVVCEQSNHMVGELVDVVVTSVLQSSAGRMIFGKLT